MAVVGPCAVSRKSYRKTLYFVCLPRTQAPVPAAHVKKSFFWLGDIAGNRVHPDRSVPADSPRIVFVIGQNLLDRVHGDRSPTGLDQLPDTVQARTGIGQVSGLVIGKRGGQVVIGMEAGIRMDILVPGDSLGPYFHGFNTSPTVAQHQVGGGAGAVPGENPHTVLNRALFQYYALYGVMRQPHLPCRSIQGIGEMGYAVLVHSRITQLSGECEHQRPWPAIAGFYP